MNRISFTQACLGTLCVAWLIAPARAQSPSPSVPPLAPTTRPAESLSVFRIYSLQYADAREVVALLQRLIEKGPVPVQLVADQRTNALIVSAPPGNHERIMDLIKILDVPSGREPGERNVHAYQLEYAHAETLAKVVAMALAQPGGRPSTLALAADAATNTLLVSGDPAETAAVESLLKQLDRQAESAAVSGRRVRILWLVSGLELPPPPPDLKDVIEELDALGIQNLRLVTQNIIQTVPGEEFSTTSAAPGFTICRLKIEGQISEKDGEPPRLRISVAAQGRMPPKPQPGTDPTPTPTPAQAPMPMPPMPNISELASLMTTVVAPPGHKVVLGVTPIEEYTSVFVIQILPGTEAPKAAAQKSK